MAKIEGGIGEFIPNGHMKKLEDYGHSNNEVAQDNVFKNAKKILEMKFGVFCSLMMLAIIITCTLSTYIRNISDYIVKHIVPEKSVTITVLGTEDSSNGAIWILDEQWIEGDTKNLFSYCLNAEKNGIWEFRSAEEWSYSNDVLVSYGENSGASISFTVPAVPESYLMFGAWNGCGKVSVEADGQLSNIDTNIEGNMTPRIYPFKNSYITIAIRLLLFGVIDMAISVILLLIYRLVILRTSLKLPWTLLAPYKNVTFVLIWIVLYLFAVIQYKIGIPNYLGGGDQVYYWGEPLLRLNAWWNPEVLAECLANFRGYWCNIPTMIAQILGALLKTDPIYIYLIFTSFSLAWLVGYVLPEMYFIFSEKRSKRINVLICLGVYLIFWNGTLTAVLVDLFGLTAFLTSVLFAIKIFRLNKIWYGVPSGICMSIACCFRSAYKYGIYVLIAYSICVCIYKMFLNRQNFVCWFQDKLWVIKKCAIGIGLSIVSFCVICIPQFQINIAGGHIGLLPYDDDSSMVLTSYGETCSTSLLIASANISLDLYSGYPIPVTDDQLLSIKADQFTKEDALNMSQILSAYSTNFTNTVVYLFKKLFIAFDVKTNISYPNAVPWNESSGMIFSMMNYVVLASAVYVFLFDKKQIKKSERILAVLLFIGLSLPQLFVHVEWRYFISSYVLLYYFFSYHFIETASDSLGRTKENSHFKFLRYICVVLCLAFTISFTIYA